MSSCVKVFLHSLHSKYLIMPDSSAVMIFQISILKHSGQIGWCLSTWSDYHNRCRLSSEIFNCKGLLIGVNMEGSIGFWFVYSLLFILLDCLFKSVEYFVGEEVVTTRDTYTLGCHGGVSRYNVFMYGAYRIIVYTYGVVWYGDSLW